MKNELPRIITWILRAPQFYPDYHEPEELADVFRQHLSKMLIEWFAPGGNLPAITDFSRYLNYLKSETRYIDIRGLVCGQGKVHQFPIDQLYIPLKTTGYSLLPERGGRSTGQTTAGMASGEISLKEALAETMPRGGLIIKGDPGAGKTTFLRLITFTLCRQRLGEEPAACPAAPFPGPDQQPLLPVFIRLGRLAEHISTWRGRNQDHLPVHEDSPEWLFHFLDQQSIDFKWEISADVFRWEIEAGHCLILLDGLDETPDVRMREQISSLASQLLSAYPECRIVLTSRPGALEGRGMPVGNFALTEIAPLDGQAMKAFLTQWSAALYAEEPKKSRQHFEELTGALQSRPDIRRMVSTPVMLTALAVVHWNENRLPEQRAELYESIITWLLRSREQRPGRLPVNRCRKLLQKLALAMFTHPDGRQRQVGLRWAAEQLCSEFESTREYTAVDLADYFLHDEMLDSGIIVERNLRLEFWHLSFQEYMAACEIAGFLEAKQVEMLFENRWLYSSEWREVVLLLSGVLYKQGLDKINHLIDEIISRGPQKGTNKNLPQLAREVGLLGAIERDLSPYKHKLANPAYPGIIRRVMGIFDKTAYRNVPVQVRLEAADALAQAGDPRFAEGDPKAGPLVSIPGGTFWMGAQKDKREEQNFDPDAHGNESPVHQVQLSPYYISKYPVTVEQYRRFIEDGGYDNKLFWEAGGFGKYNEPDEWEYQKQYPSRPVVYVSWYEAAAYACWAGGRLPTEAEWERAARGPDRDYRKYPWSNDVPTPETANFDKSGILKATPVGIFPDNCSPEGMIDMAGNVWEWCRDWYHGEYYQLCAQCIIKDPRGSEDSSGRVVRGGSFDLSQDILRCAFRLRNDPDYRNDYRCFRLVCGSSV